MIQDNRTLAELENAYLSDASAAEFDRIVRKSESRRRRPIVWGTMLAAAASLAEPPRQQVRVRRNRDSGRNPADNEPRH